MAEPLHVLMAGGGTGGHVFPALAVAEELDERGHRVSFVGSAHGLEGRLVPERGFHFETLPARPLVGRGVVGKARALATLARASVTGARLVRRLGVAVVVGTGGYVSAPAVLGGRLARRPVLLVEPNAKPGFANRQLSRFARLAAVAFEASAGALACPSEVTGVPVRREFTAVPELDAAAPGEPLRLLVVGGSQGAQVLNRNLPAVLAALGPERLRVVHQTGRDHLASTRARYLEVGVDPDTESSPVQLVRFLDEMATAMAASDLVVSRAGAITVAEIAAAGRPALFVPLTLAEGHQRDNAAAMERAGAAAMVEEEPVGAAGAGGDPDALVARETAFARRLVESLGGLLDDPERLLAMARAARATGRPDAARRIADQVERLGGRV